MWAPDRELIERWQPWRPDARNLLVERYRGLVRAVAARYADRGEPFDTVQVAWIGLLKAIDRFDSSRDVQLTTYATPTIVGEIKRHYRDNVRAVHVPRSLQELRVRVNATTDGPDDRARALPTIRGHRRTSCASARRRCSTRCSPSKLPAAFRPPTTTSGGGG